MEPTKRSQTIRGRVRGIAAAMLVTSIAACGGGCSGGSASAIAGPSGTGKAAATYTISVSVSGLVGAGLVLQLNMADDLAVPADGNFTFSTPLTSGTSYQVTVKTSPASPPQVCSSNQVGTVGNANVTGIAINCVLSDCPTLPSNSPGPSTTTAYVLGTGITQSGATNACIIGYAANSGGSVSPTVSITVPVSEGQFYTLATDSSGYIYLAANPTSQTLESEVRVFAPGANGMAIPVRTLMIPGSIGSSTLAVDGAGAIYVATVNTTTSATTYTYSILVFAPGADGNAAPIRTIVVGDAANPRGCSELAVDGNGNIICSINEVGLIQVFTNPLTGSGTLARAISTADSNSSWREIAGLSLDPAGNIYVAATGELDIGLPATIVEFAGGTVGTGTPINTLATAALPSFVGILNLGFDAAGNLFVYESGTAASMGDPTVMRFAAAANGFASPTTEVLTSFPIARGIPTGFSVH